MNLFASISGRTVVLLLTFILLSFVYLSPRIELSEKYREKYPRPTQKIQFGENGESELLKIEFAKVIDEIKFKLQLQDTWYNYKYLFIGAMLAILLGQAGLLKYLDETSPNQSVKPLKEIFASGLVYLTVTVACVICVMIDMHIRRHMIDIQSLGLWISHYAEPAFVGEINDSSQFVPWETYLRRQPPLASSTWLQNLVEGAHTIALSTQLHFLSTVAYLLYTVIFQQMCLDFPAWRDSRLKNKYKTEEHISAFAHSRKMIIFFGFIFVHLSTLVLNLIIHSVSPKYQMQLYPFNYPSYGWITFLYYSIFWVFTVAINLPYLYYVWKQPDNIAVITQEKTESKEFEDQSE